MNDMRFTYQCKEKGWRIEGADKPTIYNKTELLLLKTNITNCDHIKKYKDLDASEKAIFDKIN